MVSFMTLRFWSMVRFHFTLFPRIRVRKCLSFLNESKADLCESFGATSLRVSHKTGCSQGGREGRKIQTPKSRIVNLKPPAAYPWGYLQAPEVLYLLSVQNTPGIFSCISVCARTAPGLQLNLAGTWKPSIPLPKSTERHFSEYALQKKKEDLRKSE